MSPSAKIICDSVSPAGDRLTTMEVVMHRFVLAEFNTHRVFSRNSASSRAIPVEKQLLRAAENPAFPLVWAAEQRGMQGGDELEAVQLEYAQELFGRVHAFTIDIIKQYLQYHDERDMPRLHKSLINRLLEPFQWHTVIVSSTEWDNFFAQRCSPLAQPEIRTVAELMREAYVASQPQTLQLGEWHLPYIDEADEELTEQQKQFVSAARCARVSYLTHDGTRDWAQDVELFSRLIRARPGHWSPLEHVATPAMPDGFRTPGNFKGWAQLRHQFEPQGQQIEEIDA